MIDSTLSKIYFDLKHPDCFSSPARLFRAAVKVNRNITKSNVRHWLEAQDTYTLHRRIRTRFPRRKVLTRGIGYQHQADLVDYSALKKDNSGHTFVLTVIDCFSRFALAIPIKNKSGVTVASALDRAWKTMGAPLKLQTDLGKEFYNSNVKTLLSRLKVIHFSTSQDLKAQIVERFNRQLRETLKKWMRHSKTLRYIGALPDFLHGYNRRIHGAIAPFAPVDVTKKNERQVHNIQYGVYLSKQRRRPKFKIGDHVRIAEWRDKFRKSYASKNFTTEIFQVVDVLNTKPPTYRLQDEEKVLIQGSFYESEMQRVQKE